MDAKRFVIGTLVGGITLHVLGYLIFVLMFGAFFAANQGSATGVNRDVVLQWALALGNLSLAALVTLAVTRVAWHCHDRQRVQGWRARGLPRLVRRGLHPLCDLQPFKSRGNARRPPA